ncbi:MAG: hypothetical protein VX627_00235 [Candidatus Thermoplasmatota archaeon]|nr:hypothetical protein [Candidatus Thermoplasmatota archaeon]
MSMHWVILTGDDCPHCIELQAKLDGREDVDWLPKIDAKHLLEGNPILAASIDVLPFAILLIQGQPVAGIRAATPERMAEAEDAYPDEAVGSSA